MYAELSVAQPRLSLWEPSPLQISLLPQNIGHLRSRRKNISDLKINSYSEWLHLFPDKITADYFQKHIYLI